MSCNTTSTFLSHSTIRQVGAEVSHWLPTRDVRWAILTRRISVHIFFSVLFVLFFWGGGGRGGRGGWLQSSFWLTVFKLRFSQKSACAQEICSHEFLNIWYLQFIYQTYINIVCSLWTQRQVHDYYIMFIIIFNSTMHYHKLHSSTQDKHTCHNWFPMLST